MKPLTTTELKAKNTTDLQKRIAELRQAIKEHAFEKRTKEVKNAHIKRVYKRQLATTLSIYKEREHQEGKEK
jgi:ribosomal protein L29